MAGYPVLFEDFIPHGVAEFSIDYSGIVKANAEIFSRVIIVGDASVEFPVPGVRAENYHAFRCLAEPVGFFRVYDFHYVGAVQSPAVASAEPYHLADYLSEMDVKIANYLSVLSGTVLRKGFFHVVFHHFIPVPHYMTCDKAHDVGIEVLNT